ncbi:MAG: hypothetical protein PHI31_11535 [Desulfuromonadaceae bacterium]|nr:hypothetical protein [Desulfuromonadaceae bacterium]
MRITSISICLMSLFAASASASPHTITFYRDGALHVQEARGVKGVIETPLAAALLEHSLTITPAPGTTIVSVETVKTARERSVGSELDALAEQRLRLEDRLHALETREAIFTSAAKAQSGKAPRKTKANPDPMQAIRQGTDFAIAQLEAVYTARRRATQEIQKVDARIAIARKGHRPVENALRIYVSPLRGTVTIRYATTERGWQPHYNLFLENNGTARLQLYARTSSLSRGDQVRVSPASLSESMNGVESFPAQYGSTLLATYPVSVTGERSVVGVFNNFYGEITNTSAYYLPEGESGLFRNGVFLGKFRFEGISSGRSGVVSMGR